MLDFICQKVLENNFHFLLESTCRLQEYVFVELINALLNNNDYSNILGINYRKNNKIYFAPNQPRITNLDDVPFPYRYIFERDDIPSPYIAMIYGSRGCYGNCKMCSVCAFYENENKWIPRSPDNFVLEIENIVNRYGVKIFSFIDSDFIGPDINGIIRAKKIAELIIEKKLNIKFDIACRVERVEENLFLLLKKAGLYNVFLGVESGHEKVLKALRKGSSIEQNNKAIEVLDKLDIDIEMGFIMIFPDTTIEDIQVNLDFIMKHKIFQPYRLGSRLYTNPGFEITEELETAEIVSGNILEKHYVISDIKVKQYFKLWSRLYENILPFTNKLNVFQLHTLWDEQSVKIVKNIEKEILEKNIELLKIGISLIIKNSLTEYILLKLDRNMRDYIFLKEKYLHSIIASLKDGLPQYGWLKRKVDI